MTFATIDALRESLAQPAPKEPSSAYAAKMLHPVPVAPVVDREKFIVALCKGKRVLEIGASGPLHEAIKAAAAFVVGIDRVESDGVMAFDLDDVTLPLPTVTYRTIDVVVCGEVLEHLANPGWTLARLRSEHPESQLIVSVPNAYAKAQTHWLAKGFENVNIDHVAWYSPRTLQTLLERYGYTIEHFHWYNGDPATAEGFVVMAR